MPPTGGPHPARGLLEGHLAVYGHVDLALDPGLNAPPRCEAMYMGVPTVPSAGVPRPERGSPVMTVGLDGSGKCPSENFGLLRAGYADLAVQWAQESRRPGLCARGVTQGQDDGIAAVAARSLRNLEGVKGWWGDNCAGARAEMTKRGEGSEDNDSDASGESSQAVAMAEQ